MRGLAEYIMRGRREATLAVAIAGWIPLLLWFSAAALALVMLRRGLSDSLPVLASGLLRAVVWWAARDITPVRWCPRTAWQIVILCEYNVWLRVLLGAVRPGLRCALLFLGELGAPLQALAGTFRAILSQLREQMGVRQ